ncbi:IS30 family transposase [Psychromonas arctica]|uniref:IS30 family transposase n=1 Tax=Psychromonas arctica TaxID=168275 RepID=A0ABU9HFG2_9GAMM
MRRKGKAYQSRSKDKQAGRGFIRNRVSIDERLSIVERKTSFTVSMRVDDKSAKSVTAATIALLKPFEGAIFTITADNGKEFAHNEVMTEYLKCEVYFADPYCSWQPGLNENTNGILRQYWPKSTDFKNVSQSEVEDVIVKLNDRPRKKLNYKTLAKLMAEHMVAIAS